MEQSRVISPGELSPKQTVTILDRAPKDESYRESDFAAMFGNSSGHHPFTGTPMEVLAVDLPFVVVQVVNGPKAVIDTRGHQFMEVRPEYVQALAAQPEPSDFDRLVHSHNNLVRVVAGHDQKFREAPQKCAPPPPMPDRTLPLPVKMMIAVTLIAAALIIYAYSTR